MTANDEVHRTAEFLDDVTAFARSRLVLFWFPMIAFGLVSLGAACFAVIVKPELLGVYWMVAGGAAGVATGTHYERRELEAGLARRTSPYIAAAAVLAVGVFAIPFFLEEPAWLISVWTGVGYSLFAILERSAVVALTAAGFVVLGLIFVSIEVANEIVWVSALSGALLLGGGARLARRSSHP